MMKMQTRILLPALMAIGGLQLSGCAALTPGFDRCSNPCVVPIDLPANPGRPPELPNPTVTVAESAVVQFTTTDKVFVIFPEDTPFVSSPGGDLVYWFPVHNTEAKDLLVRADSDTVCSEATKGCKYMVVDANNEKRPVLDPYIIIDR